MAAPDDEPCMCGTEFTCMADEHDADLATELAERGLRACCGLPAEVHCR